MNSESRSEEMKATMTTNTGMSEQPVRMKLVNTAAEFLVSPSVLNSSMDMKVAFLKKKGLTDTEIDMAVKQSDARLMAIRDNGSGGGLSPSQMQLAPFFFSPPVSRWTTFRDIANSAVLVAGFCYGAYWAYQNFIVPYFFGKKEKSVETRLKQLDETVSTCLVEISLGLSKLREEMEKTNDRRTENLQKDFNDLKSEVTSLKKLLLNRKQFPSAGGMGPLGIPSWQISENEEKQQTPEEEGNGSNGSESSLEMIKE